MADILNTPTLPTFSWIGHLKEDDRDLLSSYGEFFPGHPGNVIIEEGAQQTEVFVVISGKLEVRAKQEDGTEVVLAQVGPGETLGEISLFVPGPAAATVSAVEFSQLWRIADDDLNQFMEENPGAGNVLLRTLASILAQRLRQMNPLAFGLSTYAIVDSLDAGDSPPAESPEGEPENISADIEPAPTAAAEPTPSTLSKSAAPEPRRSTPLSPPLEVPQSFQGKKLSTKTQPIPDPDELESEPI